MDEVALATDAVRQRDYSDDPGGGERDLMSIAIITHNTTLKLIGKLAREVEQLRQEVASLK